MTDEESHIESAQAPAEEDELLLELLALGAASQRSALHSMTTRIAHELNQPLSVIVSNVRGVARRLQEGQRVSPRMLAALDQAASQAKRAAEVVSRVRLELEKEAPRDRPVDVGPIARAAVRLAKPLAARRGVRIRHQVQSRRLRVAGQPCELRRALFALLLDGIQRAPGMSRRPQQLALRVMARGAAVEVTLGAGRTPAAPDVAEPGATTAAPDAPLGSLGLNVARAVVEAHGGSLDAPPPGPGGGHEPVPVRITLPGIPAHDGET